MGRVAICRVFLYKDKNTMRKLLTICALMVSGFVTHAEPILQGQPSELAPWLAGVPSLVKVSGEAELKVQADQAVVYLIVQTENKNLQDALKHNQELRSKLLQLFTKQGIGAERIQMSKFSSTPKYGWFGDKAKSYTVDNSMKLTLKTEAEFQAAASAVDDYPEVRYGGIEFENTDKDALKQKALSQACEKALAKKKVIEQELGVKLRPKSFAETGVIVTPDNALTAGFRARIETAGAYSSAPSASNQTISSFGEMIFRVSVALEFTLDGSASAKPE